MLKPFRAFRVQSGKTIFNLAESIPLELSEAQVMIWLILHAFDVYKLSRILNVSIMEMVLEFVRFPINFRLIFSGPSVRLHRLSIFRINIHQDRLVWINRDPQSENFGTEETKLSILGELSPLINDSSPMPSTR